MNKIGRFLFELMLAAIFIPGFFFILSLLSIAVGFEGPDPETRMVILIIASFFLAALVIDPIGKRMFAPQIRIRAGDPTPAVNILIVRPDGTSSRLAAPRRDREGRYIVPVDDDH